MPFYFEMYSAFYYALGQAMTTNINRIKRFLRSHPTTHSLFFTESCFLYNHEIFTHKLRGQLAITMAFVCFSFLLNEFVIVTFGTTFAVVLGSNPYFIETRWTSSSSLSGIVLLSFYSFLFNFFFF